MADDGEDMGHLNGNAGMLIFQSRPKTHNQLQGLNSSLSLSEDDGRSLLDSNECPLVQYVNVTCGEIVSLVLVDPCIVSSVLELVRIGSLGKGVSELL